MAVWADYRVINFTSMLIYPYPYYITQPLIIMELQIYTFFAILHPFSIVVRVIFTPGSTYNPLPNKQPL